MFTPDITPDTISLTFTSDALQYGISFKRGHFGPSFVQKIQAGLANFTGLSSVGDPVEIRGSVYSQIDGNGRNEIKSSDLPAPGQRLSSGLAAVGPWLMRDLLSVQLDYGELGCLSSAPNRLTLRQRLNYSCLLREERPRKATAETVGFTLPYERETERR